MTKRCRLEERDDFSSQKNQVMRVRVKEEEESFRMAMVIWKMSENKKTWWHAYELC